MQLTVKRLSSNDSWKDIVRINKKFRVDCNEKHIERGSICRISVANRCKWVIVHGREPDDAVIRMDLNVRLALDVKTGDIHDFKIDQLSWLQSRWFPWKASDPGYRLPAQLGLISFFLGTLLGILSIVLAFKK